jgi:hypothetical protein
MAELNIMFSFVYQASFPLPAAQSCVKVASERLLLVFASAMRPMGASRALEVY